MCGKINWVYKVQYNSPITSTWYYPITYCDTWPASPVPRAVMSVFLLLEGGDFFNHMLSSHTPNWLELAIRPEDSPYGGRFSRGFIFAFFTVQYQP